MLYTGSKVKLIDFNASHDMGQETEIQGNAEIGTPGYMAKEMYDGWISYKGDIYSAGVTMLEIWMGDIWPSNKATYSENGRYVLDYVSLLEKDHPELHKLVKKCISPDSNKRPFIKAVVSNLDRILGAREIVE